MNRILFSALGAATLALSAVLVVSLAKDGTAAAGPAMATAASAAASDGSAMSQASGASARIGSAASTITTAGSGQAESAELVARGAYLAKAADCAGCHTAAARLDAQGQPVQPPAFAGGLPMNSPFGTIYSSNITPDPQFGIGSYSYENFANALRKGVAPQGKHLYPAMPYPSFSKITDDDMHALYAYFMHGVAPIHAEAPATHLPFPFNQRWALGIWALLFSPSGIYLPDPHHDAQWNRGAYLVQSLGHCGACHTPRGPAYEELGYTDASRAFLRGGINDNWYAPELDKGPATGLGRYSSGEIAAFLKTGHGAGLVTFGSMVQVVEDSTQYISDEDLTAMATYLKTLPPRASTGHFAPQSRAAALSIEAIRTGDIQRPGAGLYLGLCARCHKADGNGATGRYPALAGNAAVLAPDPTSLIRLLAEGGQSPQTQTGPSARKMPAFSHDLSDTEMARVLTFIRASWGNNAPPVTSREVERTRATLGH